MRRALPVLAVLALLLPGCRAPLGPVLPLPATDSRPAALMAALAREAEGRHSLRAIARLSIEGPTGSGRAKQILVLERPARLRVEVLGFLNQTVALLVTDDGRYRLYRSEDRSLEEGPVYDALLYEVAGVGLTPEEAVDVLLGSPAPPAPPVIRASALLPDGMLRVELARGADGLRRSLAFDAEARLRRLEVYARQELLWEARFDDHRRVGDATFPHALELRFPASRTRAEVSFRDVELNPELPPGAFSLRVPGDTARAREPHA